jgi:Mrp family chromosome partitioning ATPase
VDAVIVVARLEVTPKEAAKRAVSQLRRVPGVNVVGVVANDITGAEAGKYSYGYQSLDFKA